MWYLAPHSPSQEGAEMRWAVGCRDCGSHRSLPSQTPPETGKSSWHCQALRVLPPWELPLLLGWAQQTALHSIHLRIFTKTVKASFQMGLVSPRARTDQPGGKLSLLASLGKSFMEEAVTSCGSWMNTGARPWLWYLQLNSYWGYLELLILFPLARE